MCLCGAFGQHFVSKVGAGGMGGGDREAVGPQEMPLEGESVHGVCVLLSLCCVAFTKVPWQPSCLFFSQKELEEPQGFSRGK